MIDKINEAKDFIMEQIGFVPELCIVLGSGLGSLADQIEYAVEINYGEIPYFPTSTVAGHDGKLVCGKLNNRNIIALKGRFHFYEGYTMQEVTFYIRVMRSLGIEQIILTNAAGGLRLDLTPGSLMLITDHINMTGTNPLIGENYDELGVRFPDMSQAYDKGLADIAKSSAECLDIRLNQGIYAGITGPSYATKAELNMLITIGADAIGMSTVAETIVAVHSGMKVLGITCITDCANPQRMEAPSHEEIVKIAELTKPKFISLLKKIVENI